MDDIYILSDAMVLNKVGNHLRTLRLKQNITQQSLAEAANVSLSTVKKMEKGEIRSFDAFLRVLRTLGRLDVLQPLVEEPQLSPSEYFDLVATARSHERKRAGRKPNGSVKEESTW